MGSWFWTWATRSWRNVCSWARGSVALPDAPEELDELDPSDAVARGEGPATLAGVIIIRSAPGLSGAAIESLKPGRPVRVLSVPLLLLLLAGRTSAVAGAAAGLAGIALSGT